jgi:putative hydrolase of the HAD superfamily
VSEIRAVVFDLYGTLVPEFGLREWHAMFEGMAEALGAELDAFRSAWEGTMIERQTGRLGDMEGNVREIAARAGVTPSPAQVEAALEIRADLYRRCFRPKPDAVPVLAWLRDEGYLVALVSMCAPDTPPMWHASPMSAYVDVVVFSSETGLRKPDAEIYLRATEGLGVEPSDCLYVGDGSYRELTGAAAVGMHPVLILDAGDGTDAVLQPQPDDWDGPSIGSLAEVPALLRA